MHLDETEDHAGDPLRKRWISPDDLSALRAGHYADPPYTNIVELLSASPASVSRDVCVETHWIPRRSPFTVLAGVPRALEILDGAIGRWDGDVFRLGASDCDIWAVPDGTVMAHDGFPMNATPALVVSGRYREFAHLKTPVLGTLARASRVATNVYRTLIAAGGKPVFTFCARYDAHEVQALDGYAYAVAIKAYNRDHGGEVPLVVSTGANSDFTMAPRVGTLSHEAIACFLGDATSLMLRFCETLPADRLRVALVDFDNDAVGGAQAVMRAVYEARRKALRTGDSALVEKFRLDGVRVDTSGELVDVSLRDRAVAAPGVSPALVQLLRLAIDKAWEGWDLSVDERDDALAWCAAVKIIASGGFDEHRIRAFEADGVPVDAYGVGSALLGNSPGEGTVTDFSAGVVRVQDGHEWRPIAKAGRAAHWDRRLEPVTSNEGARRCR